MTLAVTSACLRRLMVVSSLAADSVALSQAERIAMSVAACAPEEFRILHYAAITVLKCRV